LCILHCDAVGAADCLCSERTYQLHLQGLKRKAVFLLRNIGKNSPRTQLKKSDEVLQHQLYGKLKSYNFIVSIPFNYKFISLKLQHSSPKGETALKYAYTIMADATLPT
jgi:hypothetical protein